MTLFDLPDPIPKPPKRKKVTVDTFEEHVAGLAPPKPRKPVRRESFTPRRVKKLVDERPVVEFRCPKCDRTYDCRKLAAPPSEVICAPMNGHRPVMMKAVHDGA